MLCRNEIILFYYSMQIFQLSRFNYVGIHSFKSRFPQWMTIVYSQNLTCKLSTYLLYRRALCFSRSVVWWPVGMFSLRQNIQLENSINKHALQLTNVIYGKFINITLIAFFKKICCVKRFYIFHQSFIRHQLGHTCFSVHYRGKQC
jgi:hypothetical protein